MLSFLKSNFEESRENFIEKNLIIKDYKDLGLHLIKYNFNNTELDNDTKKCKGLIIDDNCNIVCIPPYKSEDINLFLEESVNDNEDIIYEEFIDGTMINIFYYKDSWHISTRSCIGANCRWYSKKRFSELFEDCKNFVIENLNKSYCYNMVLKHPENRIVKNYSTSSLVLVGCYKINATNDIEALDLNKVKSELHESNINIEIPKRYDFTSITDAISFVNELTYEDPGIILKRFNNNDLKRAKLQNPNYTYVKNLKGNSRSLKYLFIELRKNNNVNEYLDYYPEHKEIFSTFLKNIYDLTKKLFNYYQNFRVKKTIEYNDIEYQYRPLVFELHGIYLKKKTIITLAKVKEFVNNMDTPQLIYTLNYRELDNVESEK